MQIRGDVKRVKMIYKEWIRIPEPFRKFVWDSLNGKAPLESVILKVLMYGKFEDIKKLYEMYPEETYTTAFRYPEIKRGIKFWLKRWRDGTYN